jgi:hypothetical protein
LPNSRIAPPQQLLQTNIARFFPKYVGIHASSRRRLGSVLVVNYFNAAIGQPHVPYLWILERGGIDSGAVIARDSLPQVIDIDVGQLLYDWPWPGMP